MEKIKLDLKDRRILYELDTNSRRSFSEIGKKVGLSKEVVNYRVKRLTQEGIIKGFTAAINIGKLGYTSFRLYVRLSGATPSKEAEIVQYLVKTKIVQWVASAEGNWHIAFWVCTKTISEFNNFYRTFFSKYVKYIDEHRLGIWTKCFLFRRAFILGIKEDSTEPDIFITCPENLPLRSSDLKILKILVADARTPTVEIAKKTGLSPKSVDSRIKLMKDSGVIVNFRTIFDLGKLGITYYKVNFSLRSLDKDKVKSLKEYAHLNPNVVYDNETLGGWDFEIDVQTFGDEEFESFMDEFRTRFSNVIRSYEILKFRKEHKFVFLPTEK
ncbi:MAG: Lrp/AsnC family transcriptional regulator [Candidatus Micrarchaeota archaeon]|nr:Lrp/AsnC family transcriptional regulator [Candidatus Micrarchaeota archaeon]